MGSHASQSPDAIGHGREIASTRYSRLHRWILNESHLDQKRACALCLAVAFSLYNEAYVREPLGSTDYDFVHKWVTGFYNTHSPYNGPVSYLGRLGNSMLDSGTWETDAVKYRGAGSFNYTGKWLYSKLGLAGKTNSEIDIWFYHNDQSFITDTAYISSIILPQIGRDYSAAQVFLKTCHAIGYSPAFLDKHLSLPHILPSVEEFFNLFNNKKIIQ